MNTVKGKLKPIAFIDNDINKIGGSFQGLPVISFNDMKSLQPDYIVVTTQFYEQTLNQLIESGLKVCHCSDVIRSQSGQ